MDIRRPLGLGLVAVTALAVATPSAAVARELRPAPVAGDQHIAAQVRSAASTARDEQRRGRHGRPSGNTTLDAALSKLVADGAIGVTGRVESPTTTWAGAAGLRGRDRKAPALATSRFRVASNTKMMVATLVLQEVERGTWRLDQPVAEVMPSLLPGHPDVTFRQLLSHTSGMPTGTNELLLGQMTDHTSVPQLLAAISHDYTPQMHIDAVNAAPWTAPGQFLYSNAGYVALGMLLEHQERKGLATLLHDRVWKPAGMHQTSFATDPGLRGNALAEDGWMGADGWLELDGFDPDFFWAAGAVVSTTEDLDDLTRALVTGRLVRKDLVAEMMTPVSTAPMEYGLGLYRIPDPCPAPGADPYLYGHDGASFGTLSVAFTSVDGTRRFSAAATGRDVSGAQPRWNLNDALVPMLMGTCPAS